MPLIIHNLKHKNMKLYTITITLRNIQTNEIENKNLYYKNGKNAVKMCDQLLRQYRTKKPIIDKWILHNYMLDNIYTLD